MSPISQEMLNILCCPVSKVKIRVLFDKELEKANAAIAAGGVKDVSGIEITEPLVEGLITEDEKMIYRIDNDIPVMLAESGIPTDRLKGFHE